MIFGIGTDLISVKRIEHLLQSFEEKFLKKIFTDNEINIAKDLKDHNNSLRRSLYFAKRFAAKEAFSKAIGLGIGRGVDFADIEIINDEYGKPKIVLLNQKDKFVKKHMSAKDYIIHLSLTDEKTYATAVVIIEKVS